MNITGPYTPHVHRTGDLTRNTAETQIQLALDLDGEGKGDISTGVPFFDHMLILLAKHGQFDLHVKAVGDLAVDYHHLVEDVGIVLGLVLKGILGDNKGLARYGHAIVPIDEALAMIALDISGRGFIETQKAFDDAWVRDFDVGLLEEFFRAFAMNAGITLHVRMLSGVNAHHKAEAAFKGFARALRDATRVDPRVQGVNSTKGMI